MPAISHPDLAPPFDTIAGRYDEAFTSSSIGEAQRAAVWRKLGKTYRPGDHILEIGCGTGVDACFLAERNIRVAACDSSPQMIDVATHRIQQRGLQKLVRPFVMRAEDIMALPADELFDGVFSNFGVLNCVEDLKGVARRARQIAKTGRECRPLLDGALLCMGNRVVSRTSEQRQGIPPLPLGRNPRQNR